jgi:hypothetical protein
MIRSLSSRLGGAVAALVLGTTALAAVGVSAPANAATVTCTSRATLETSTTNAVYGDYMYLAGAVKHTCPGEAEETTYYGNAVLQRALPGQGWANIATAEAGGFMFSDVVKSATVSAYYRVVYQGGDNGSSSSLETYPATTSNSVHVTVNRSLAGSTIKKHGGKAVARIKVTPGVSGKFVMQVKKGKKWKKVRKVAFRSGRATVKVSYPRHGKTTYRIVVPASGGYPALPVVFWVKRL